MTKNESNPHPYVPSGFFMRHVVNPITVRLGGPTLTAVERRTGRPISTSVPPSSTKALATWSRAGARPTGSGTCGPPSGASFEEAAPGRRFAPLRSAANSTTGSLPYIENGWARGRGTTSRHFPIRPITQSSVSTQ